MVTSLHRYRIFDFEQFRKNLKSIAWIGQGQTAGRLRRPVYRNLRDHTHFGPRIPKLQVYSPERWSCRIGSWQFSYGINDLERVVSMTAASHRGSEYWFP